MMTVKELYDWAVANNYEDLPIAMTYENDYGDMGIDGLVSLDTITVRTDRHENITALYLEAKNGDYCFD